MLTSHDSYSLARDALLAGIPADQRAQLAARHDGVAERLLSRLDALYGAQPDFAEWLETLFGTLGQLAAARPAALAALDTARAADPGWLAQPGMLGYCAYVDRFGGTLNGVAHRVDHLQKLGVRYLHLLPFLKMRAGDNDGGFAVSSFDEVEPRLGNNDDLLALTERLRAAGISLCADFVLNHVADDHPWALAAKRGEARYRRYFRVVRERSAVERWESTLGQVFPDVAPGNFTEVPPLGGWVWTTFYPYQWDLDYRNPEVFAEIACALIRLANLGVEVFRLDSAPFLWKREGGPCVNEPEVHTILQALRAIIDIVAPGVLLKAEAIVPTRDLPPYFGSGDARGHECHLAYHSSLMAAGWAALAEQRSDLLNRVIDATPELPAGNSWLTYVRCHDDIVWSTLKPEIADAGDDYFARLLKVTRFLAGESADSYARGAHFQASETVPVFGTNGMTASLVGLASADDDRARDAAEQRLQLLYGLAFAFGGLPLIYMGDELGQPNDDSAELASARAADGRWLQRPRLDAHRLAARDQPGTGAERVFTGLQRLAECRRALPALSANAPRQRLPVDDPALLLLARGGRFVAVFNFAAEARPLPLAALPGGQHWTDALSGQPLDSGQLLPGGSMLWLTAAD